MNRDQDEVVIFLEKNLDLIWKNSPKKEKLKIM